MKPEYLHVGDWVRYTGPEKQWSGVVGTIKHMGWATACVDTTSLGHGHRDFFADVDNLEPWRPKVGETVRYPATGAVGVVEQITPYGQSALVRDGSLARWIGSNGLEPAASQGDAQEQYLARELARPARQTEINVDHAGHGRGFTEDGPVDFDCDCRGTDEQANCAAAGCGFCGPMSYKTPSGMECHVGIQRTGLYVELPKNQETDPARIERVQLEVDLEILHNWLAMIGRKMGIEGGPGLAARNDLKPPRHPERWREKTMTWGPYADWDNLPDA